MKKQKHKTINRWVSIKAVTLIFLWLHSQPLALADDAVSEDIYHRLDTLFAEHHWSRATELMAAYLQQHPTDLVIRTRLLQQYLLQNNRYEAEILAAQAQNLYPGKTIPVLLSGDIALGPLVAQTETFNPAVASTVNQLAMQASAISELDPASLYLKGMAAKAQGHTEEAETYLLRSLHQDPNFLRAQQALIELYADQKRPQLATNILLQAMDEDPENVDTLYLVGKVLILKGEPEKALTYLQKSQDLDPRPRPKRQLMIGEAQRELGLNDAAASNYQQVLKASPDQPDTWLKYADVSEKLKREDEALRAYQKAYTLKPEILDALLSQAEQAFWTDSLETALNDYRRISQIAPERPEIPILMAAIAFRLWEENKPPAEDTLGFIENQLRNRNGVTPALQLADLELQVTRSNQWSPGLNLVLSQLARSGTPSLTVAYSQLLLQQPAQAEETAKPFLETPLTSEAVQMMVLHGAWPWAAQVANSGSLASWVSAWGAEQKQKADSAYVQAQQPLEEKQWDEAEKLLTLSAFYFPFSARVQLRLAEVYLGQEKTDKARDALNNALKLGLPQADAEDVTRLQKRLKMQ